MKIYIAAPFFNPRQLEIVEQVEKELMSNGIEFYSPRSEGILSEMSEDEQQENKSDIFKKNISNMDSCTHMIACVEQKDTGTIFEMGYFHAQKKPIVMFSEDLSLVNVMLAEAAKVCDRLDMIGACFNGMYSVKPKRLT